MPALRPEPLGFLQRLYSLPPPPVFFAACGMKRAVMGEADGDGPLIADLARHGPRLGMPDVMGMAWSTITDQAWLRGHELEVGAISHATRQRGRRPRGKSPRLRFVGSRGRGLLRYLAFPEAPFVVRTCSGRWHNTAGANDRKDRK